MNAVTPPLPLRGRIGGGIRRRPKPICDRPAYAGGTSAPPVHSCPAGPLVGRRHRFFVTVGAKYEHNAFSGGELQRNVRPRLLLAHSQVVWGAVSRAVRRPTRLENDVAITSVPGQPLVVGSDTFEAESLVAIEGGYRFYSYGDAMAVM